MSPRQPARPRELRSQGTWALVDQIFSSGTNFVPSLILARLLGPQNFGTFSLAFLAWFLVLSVIRSAFMQPYTLGASSLEQSEWRELTARAGGVVVAAGLAAAVMFGVAGLAIGVSSELGRCLLAVALLSPGLALQEFWRVAAFASRRARTAAANDLYWALGQTVAFVALLLATRITAAESLLAWGAGAWLAAALGVVQLSVWPRIDGASAALARQWLRVGVWFTSANVTFSAGLFAVAAIVAWQLGSHELGLFRVVQGSLFGPVQLVLIAVQSVLLPHIVRSMRGTDPTGLGAAARYSGAIALLVAAYGGVLVLVAPTLLTRVFGSAFAPAAALVVPMLVAFTIDAAGEGAAVLLRARARGGSLLTVQMAAAVTRLLAVLLLVRVDGVVGAAWGLAIGSAVSTMLCWLFVTDIDPGGVRARCSRLFGVNVPSDDAASSDLDDRHFVATTHEPATAQRSDTVGSD